MNTSASEPSTGELVTHLRDLLGSALYRPTKSFLIHKLLTAVSRQRLAGLRLPITRPVLHELIKSLQHTTPSAFQRCLYSATFLLAFYGFSRVGELAAKSGDRADSVLQFNDLKFLVNNGQPQMIKIIITAFKRNTLHLLRSINLTPNFPGVYNFVALIPVDTKATAFELALLRSRLIRVSQMRKSALLAAGNLMLSKYISALNASKLIKLNMSIGHAPSKHFYTFFYFSSVSEM